MKKYEEVVADLDEVDRESAEAIVGLAEQFGAAMFHTLAAVLTPSTGGFDAAQRNWAAFGKKVVEFTAQTD